MMRCCCDVAVARAITNLEHWKERGTRNHVDAKMLSFIVPARRRSPYSRIHICICNLPHAYYMAVTSRSAFDLP